MPDPPKAAPKKPAPKPKGRKGTTAKNAPDTSSNTPANKENNTAPTPKAPAVQTPASGEKSPLLISNLSAANASDGGGHTVVEMQKMMAEMKAELERERKMKKHMEEVVKKHVAQEKVWTPEDEARDNAQVMKDFTELKEMIEEEKKTMADLRSRYPGINVDELVGGPATDKMAAITIPRPKGTAGTHFSIQTAMRLSGSEKKAKKYQALVRNIHDLVHNARFPWELHWKDIPVAEKAKLYAVARERHPVLERYTNDWATEELVKQYIKNKRGHHYNNGWLEVPQKYAYLKDNASKRNPSGSRVKRAKVELAAKKKGKAKAVQAQRTPKAGTSKRMDVDDDEEEEEEEGGGEDEEEDVMVVDKE